MEELHFELGESGSHQVVLQYRVTVVNQSNQVDRVGVKCCWLKTAKSEYENFLHINSDNKLKELTLRPYIFWVTFSITI